MGVRGREKPQQPGKGSRGKLFVWVSTSESSVLVKEGGGKPAWIGPGKRGNKGVDGLSGQL